MTDWTELKRLAEEATPGPWEISEDSAGGRDELYCYWHRIGPIEIPGISADKNGLFIAAANPKTILALIAENERLRIQPERNEAVIDLDALAWESIKEAANNSPWMPEQYMLNDLVADVCEFLREPARQVVCDERYQFDSAYEQVVENGWDNVKNMAWQIWQARAALKEKQ